MSDIYFGSPRGCALVPVSRVPSWLVNTILANGAAVEMGIKEPAGLFVVSKGTSFALVGDSGIGTSSERATPFRVFVDRQSVHYIQVPAGLFDVPGENKITVLSSIENKVLPIAMSVSPVTRYGWIV